jgi:hypothetical protein
MNNMLAKLTADGFLHRLGFNGRSTLRCVSPDISSNPAAARQLIKKYSVHKNVKAEFTQELSLTSQKCEPEISSRETQKRNDDDDQLKLHAQVATTPSVVVVASSWPGDDDEPTEIVEKLTEKLKLSYDQSKTVQFYLHQDGKGYVLEKVRITRSKDLRNAGGFFIRALEKDYREPVTNTKPPLLLRRNGLSPSLKSRKRRTKNWLKPVRNCENSSRRYGHPARSFFYGVFKENLFKRQKRNDWLALARGQKNPPEARSAPERPRGWTRMGLLRGGFGPLSINVLGFDFLPAVIR